MTHPIQVTELAAWSFDLYAYRPEDATLCLAPSRPFESQNPLHPASANQQADLDRHAQRPDLHREMHGLDWTLGLIDLRQLLAFQRRLCFDPNHCLQTVSPLQTSRHPERSAQHAVEGSQSISPRLGRAILSARDRLWPTLLDICMALPKPTPAQLTSPQPGTYKITSSDPNLTLTPGTLQLTAGSPFLEAAEYRGRWFLRDGYHRAFLLLQAGVQIVPAVLIHARTLAELGATEPRFFPETTLFSSNPPRVTDFLDPALTLRYTRPRLRKTLTITVQESFTPELEEPS